MAYHNASTTPNETISGMERTVSPRPVSVQVVLTLVVVLTSLGTLIGNTMVIYAYFTTRALRTYTNYYVLNLAVIDLIGGLFPMPTYGLYWILGYWPLSTVMCDFYLWVNHTTLNATFIAILIITIDRFRSIMSPMKHLRSRHWKHALKWILSCYIIPIFLWTPTIFIWPEIGGRSFPPHVCQPEYTNNLGFAAFAQVYLFWIPTITMGILYTKIYMVIKNRDLSMQNSTKSESNSRSDVNHNMKKENHAAERTLTFILVLYVAAGAPWAILVIIFKMCPTCIPIALYQASVYTARLNSLLNPVCYAAANRLFKKAFVKIICFYCRQADRVAEHQQSQNLTSVSTAPTVMESSDCAERTDRI